jgi:hypothetical protein
VIARQARGEFERNGIGVDKLLACEPEGPDGTRLPGCVKTYLGPTGGRGPGRWGMVFRLAQHEDGPTLRYLAFGVRHQPTAGRAPTVYYLADRRLNEGS